MTDDERELLLLLADHMLCSNTRPDESRVGQLAKRIRYLEQIKSIGRDTKPRSQPV